MEYKFDDPLKTEVWQTVLAMNRCWTTPGRDPSEELKSYFHRDMVAITPTDPGRREGQEACVAGWAGFAKAAEIHRWEELEPRIDVYGDSAVVTYYYDMSFTMGGRRIDTKGRDMFFLVKEGGKWWAVADQFSPAPGSLAA